MNTDGIRGDHKLIVVFKDSRQLLQAALPNTHNGPVRSVEVVVPLVRLVSDWITSLPKNKLTCIEKKNVFALLFV